MGISKEIANANWLANAKIFKKVVEVPASLKDKLKSNKGLGFHRGFYGKGFILQTSRPQHFYYSTVILTTGN